MKNIIKNNITTIRKTNKLIFTTKQTIRTYCLNNKALFKLNNFKSFTSINTQKTNLKDKVFVSSDINNLYNSVLPNNELDTSIKEINTDKIKNKNTDLNIINTIVDSNKAALYAIANYSIFNSENNKSSKSNKKLNDSSNRLDNLNYEENEPNLKSKNIVNSLKNNAMLLPLALTSTIICLNQTIVLLSFTNIAIIAYLNYINVMNAFFLGIIISNNIQNIEDDFNFIKPFDVYKIVKPSLMLASAIVISLALFNVPINKGVFTLLFLSLHTITVSMLRIALYKDSNPYMYEFFISIKNNKANLGTTINNAIVNYWLFVALFFTTNIIVLAYILYKWEEIKKHLNRANNANDMKIALNSSPEEYISKFDEIDKNIPLKTKLKAIEIAKEKFSELYPQQ